MYLSHYKRICDLFLSVVAIVIMLVPLAIVAFLSLVCSGGPILFFQDRIGRQGRVFKVVKFRTMVYREDIGSTITVGGDARVTKIGSFLRRWKLDELPQLWNVLKGDMSFVGPRPDMPGYLDQLKGRERLLLELRPGITSPASLKYRHEEEILSSQSDPNRYNDETIFPDKIRINLEYHSRCSLCLDLKIILITVGVMKNRTNSFWMK